MRTAFRPLSVVALVAAALLALGAEPAFAPHPATKCGTTTVKGRQYKVRAVNLSCSKAAPWVRAYVRDGSRPRGYSCRKIGGDVVFSCSGPKGRSFYALRG